MGNMGKEEKAAEFLIMVSNYLVLGTVNSYRRRSSYRENPAIPNGAADHHLVYADEAEANGRPGCLGCG